MQTCVCLLQVRLAYDVFMLSGVLTELGIPASELTGFLSAVSAHYHSPEDVPYHNLAHVVQVLHGVWLASHINQCHRPAVIRELSALLCMQACCSPGCCVCVYASVC